MGTWGAGSFENDAVLDWLAEVEDGGAKVIRNALETVADADPSEYLDADDAQAALGAAEIVAAAAGKGDDRVAEQEDLVAWLEGHRKDFGPADVALARQAAARVLKSSELQELWDENGPDNEWRPVVTELVRRLSPDGKGAAPAKAPAPAKKATKTVASPEVQAKKAARTKTASSRAPAKKK